MKIDIPFIEAKFLKQKLGKACLLTWTIMIEIWRV